jgi:hypothetical protein
VPRLSAAAGDRTSSNEWQEAARRSPVLMMATTQAILQMPMHNLQVVRCGCVYVCAHDMYIYLCYMAIFQMPMHDLQVSAVVCVHPDPKP